MTARILLSLLILAGSATAATRHDLIVHQIPASWDRAIPLGNGMLGALVWKHGESLRLSLDRADLWDSRPMKGLERKEFSYGWIGEMVKKNEYSLVQKYFDAPYEKEPAPTKIPGASLSFDVRRLGPVRSVRLSLDSALCVIRWKNGTVLTTFVHAVRPSGWFRWQHLRRFVPPSLDPPPYVGAGDTAARGSVEGDNLVRLGYSAGTVTSGKTSITYRQEGWGGLSYEACVRWQRRGPETIEGTWTISSHPRTGPGGASASTRCAEALARGFSADIGTHARWWKVFWSKSAVSIPDTLIEKQWYLEQYLTARGAPDLPPGNMDRGQRPNPTVEGGLPQRPEHRDELLALLRGKPPGGGAGVPRFSGCEPAGVRIVHPAVLRR